MNGTSARFPISQALRIEWATFGLITLCYAGWAAAVFWIGAASPALAVPVLVLALVLHASLTHEVCHGHPFPSRIASEALVWINPGLAVPYLRFRDTHLAHHQDSILTDPYDDPESNYLDPAHWGRMPIWAQALRRANNTLAGRMILGPILGQVAFMEGDWRAIRRGERQVLRGWLWHLPGAALVLALVYVSPLPLWLYLVCCYAALSVLKIRTFLEHRAHERASGRTVIIEDRGLLAFLFLNNNLHVVHHMHPKVPWYRLPALYAQNKARYLARNDGYLYRSYGQIFRQFLWRAKDPVPHPLWPDRDG
ncbi:fatty acid desaturase [Aliishimia ponticola]|uniref:Fatty acid desaturase n=1 Tax=Aliishimia ponticola TaxID=2499833 RepID=A0A4V3XK65_9RHOB|nr:fatty acid desaturase [Aliishimia ponticola]THH35733.1 fatty acid desaturase [Aliishimia ponticola]